MTTLRTISTAGYPKATSPASFGKPARLEWLAIKQLVIDPEYQREISKAGRANVIKIVAAFDWSMFAPVIVAPAGSNLYAIVDGQHRTTAAALCGIDRVPCAIIDGARAAQAAAFAAINTVVTAMSPLQVHAAKIAAGADTAAKLGSVCREAGVSICRYPVPASKMKVGETLAVGKLYRLLDQYGERTLIAALSCITRSRDGYPGLVRGQIVAALCAVLEAEPAWRDSSDLIKAMNGIDIAEAFGDARRITEGSNSRVITTLIETFNAHLEDAFGAFSKPPTAAKFAAASAPEKPAPVLEHKEGRTATYGEIVIYLEPGNESLRHRGKTQKVSRRQAGLVELLARGMPNPIGRNFLRDRIFGAGHGAQADVQLDLLASETKRNAKAIGLEIREVKGIGFQLVQP